MIQVKQSVMIFTDGAAATRPLGAAGRSGNALPHLIRINVGGCRVRYRTMLCAGESGMEPWFREGSVGKTGDDGAPAGTRVRWGVVAVSACR
ncbi:MAG: hypothetical protein PHT60_01700 [Acidiphilium sp.]|nr:hypothetical protein [Acidiphilium sp.]MDD4934470.1 hypothetical protein [Acidiphilium sp.]